MPRGKYPRQSASVKAAIAKTAPAVVEAKQPEPVAQVTPEAIDPALLDDAAPPIDQPDDQPDDPPVVPPAPVANPNARRPHRFADHAKSRDIDSLTHDELRAYGLEIGMSRRDCADLSLDRLRAGCRAHLTRHFDELTE